MHADAPPPVADASRPKLLIPRLSVMMFLEFAVWGAWSVTIAMHMGNLKFEEYQVSLVFGTTAIGAMLSPVVAGWVADRFMPNQMLTGLLHLVSSVFMYYAWQQTEFLPMWVLILCYAVLYMPTIALTNAIAFHHMGDSRNFGAVRLFGTIGWIVVGFLFGLYLQYWEEWTPDESRVGDCMLWAAVIAAFMGFYCFTLPNTPPAKEAKNPYAFLEAFKLTEKRNFAVLLIISFFVAIELPFYYNLTPLFLKEPSGMGFQESSTTWIMLIGQVAEIAFLAFLAPAIRLMGMRGVIFLGILAWPIRYGIFAIGGPAWLVIGAQSLHGICYAFFFVGGMIAVERLAQRDIRASAQGLIVFATNGVGMLIGHFLSGWIHGIFRLPDGGWDWAKIFALPIIVTAVASVVFVMLFSERQFQEEAERIKSLDAARSAS